MRSVKVLMMKAVRRCPDVINVRVLDAACGVSSREAQCEGACCRRNAMVNLSTSVCGGGDAMVSFFESYC